MISVMASVMIVQTALIYQVQHHTSIARTYLPSCKASVSVYADILIADAAGIGAAIMLFVFQGAVRSSMSMIHVL